MIELVSELSGLRGEMKGLNDSIGTVSKIVRGNGQESLLTRMVIVERESHDARAEHKDLRVQIDNEFRSLRAALDLASKENKAQVDEIRAEMKKEQKDRRQRWQHYAILILTNFFALIGWLLEHFLFNGHTPH